MKWGFAVARTYLLKEDADADFSLMSILSLSNYQVDAIMYYIILISAEAISSSVSHINIYISYLLSRGIYLSKNLLSIDQQIYQSLYYYIIIPTIFITFTVYTK